MSAWFKTLGLCVATAALTACGGGGSSNGNDGFAAPAPWEFRYSLPGAVTSLPSNRAQIPPEQNSPYWVQFNVRVQRSDGTPVRDGTAVNLTTNDVRVLALGRLDDPATVDVNEFSQLFGTLNVSTVGGLATFFLHSGERAGSVQLTSSTFDTEANRTVAGTFNFSVTEGPAPFKRIQIEPLRTTLPPNLFGVSPFIGSPFIAELTVTRRNIRGELLGGGSMAASINPVQSAGFSQLDDPTTTDVNEFTNILGAGPLTITAGRKTLFVHAFSTPGPATLTITAQDPDTGANLSETQVFTVASQTPDLPAEIDVTIPTGSLYIQGSGGRNSEPIQARVTNGSGTLVPDPVSGGASFNNVQWDIVDQGLNGGETITGVNAAGQNVEGRSIRVRTQQGIAGATVRTGTRQGILVLRATADRADNNVDNGIQQAVTEDAQIVVSDGKLFSLKITSPDVNALRINRVSAGVAPIGGNQAIPTDPNGTYSLTISVLATDRQGNPVLPNTPIDFGLIDAPISGFPSSGAGDFLISGNDGDPQEGGNLFTAPGGRFTTAGGGAGPGDTLLVFGEQSNPNRDLESARRVERINSANSLSVTQRFNLNNDTGSTVNSGPVLPYIIGKATVANITPNVFTNELGIATTTMNYPVNQLGRIAAIWARGSGEQVQGTAELVTDAEVVVFPGAAPGQLVASPSTIPGNTTTAVTICVQDALAAPIQGVPIGFRVTNPPTTLTVDGRSNEGTLTRPTGSDGCTTATVTSAGVVNSAGSARTITFFGVGGSSVVTIAPPAVSILQAYPSAFFGGNGGPIRLRLIDGNGVPIPGVLITGTCTASGGAQIQIPTPPGITNANGETQTTVLAINLDQPQGTATGSCTFTAAGGSPSTTVTFEGVNLCRIFASPTCPG